MGDPFREKDHTGHTLLTLKKLLRDFWRENTYYSSSTEADNFGRTDKTVDIQEMVRELKARPHPERNAAESFHSRTHLQIDISPARIIQMIPDLAREIEGTTISDQLSRICNRIETIAGWTSTTSLTLI